MRKRIRRQGKTRRRELVITASRGERLDSRQLAWLLGEPHRTLLGIDAFGGRCGRNMTFSYDVEGLARVGPYLRRRRLDEERLGRMLVDVALAQISCAMGPSPSLLFDAKAVFVDADGHLAFVCVPLAGRRFDDTPLTLLRTMGDARRARLDGPAAQDLARSLAEFVVMADGVFSLNRFRAFIRTTCGIDVGMDGAVRRLSGTSGGMWDEVAAHDEIPAALDEEPPAQGRTLRPPLGAPAGLTFVHGVTSERLPARTGGWVLVGRGSACDVRVRGNPRLGRRHLVLKCTDKGVVLRDLGSSNGTMVAGGRLDPAREVLVPYGTRFWMAGEECMVRTERDLRWH